MVGWVRSRRGLADLLLVAVAAIATACGGTSGSTPNPTVASTPEHSSTLNPPPGESASPNQSQPVGSSVATAAATATALASTIISPAAPTATAISYVCPYVTLDEIVAITGRSVLEGREQVDGLCAWILGPKPGEPAGEPVHAWLRPWQAPLDADLFRGNYENVPQSWREPGVGDGAYWQSDVLNFLHQDKVYQTEYDDPALAEAELRSICVAIAEAALPRL